ncbi:MULTISPECIES: CBO0543 family protein [unclassified Candidatus Frackibacter]|uniref:CBO0543 family protein n=1 Tax=unclassified Candidatus Frackibacter TaxID=2648818 RepID=UPI0008848BB7|nr:MULTISPECIES: CBO0543 family protein [unclassified Candidatus Frackibacter]SDC69301.1 hypothetical protein SAMN04515661_11964 [Candidatus Frackibacter sp. WG11]SEN03518.1 hypothetical protein SAMN04488698_1431 [Candidatus Frackibacter sp. WG12]SFL92898.1 hypothetical protein SAMN04488699_12064 [Candidatus Frackibacter sp. WG13]
MDSMLKEKLLKIQNQVNIMQTKYYDLWYDEILFSWRWWLTLILATIPWIIWIKFRKKESTDRLLYVALFVIGISSWLDFLGLQLGLWFYPVDLVPSIPAYISYDFCILPVTYMGFIQIRPKVSPLLKGITIGVINAFIAEPILIALDMYVESNNWSKGYSFIIYVLIYLVAHKISRRSKFKSI